MNFALIVPAAGSGSRTGRTLPKQYALVAGKSVLEHALRPFTALDACKEIVVAVAPSMWDLASTCIGSIECARLVVGGADRGQSIAHALDVVDRSVDLILVHDAARPCVDVELVLRVIRAAVEHGAAIPAMPIPDTVKRVDRDGIVVETLDRSMLRVAQTPQAFRREILVRAYGNARRQVLTGTDDAALVEALGLPIHTVVGDTNNIKITTEEDFASAEAWLLSHS